MNEAELAHISNLICNNVAIDTNLRIDFSETDHMETAHRAKFTLYVVWSFFVDHVASDRRGWVYPRIVVKSDFTAKILYLLS